MNTNLIATLVVGIAAPLIAYLLGRRQGQRSYMTEQATNLQICLTQYARAVKDCLDARGGDAEDLRDARRRLWDTDEHVQRLGRAFSASFQKEIDDLRDQFTEMVGQRDTMPVPAAWTDISRSVSWQVARLVESLETYKKRR